MALCGQSDGGVITSALCATEQASSKHPFEDMAHIKLSYDFDLEISPGPVLGF